MPFLFLACNRFPNFPSSSEYFRLGCNFKISLTRSVFEVCRSINAFFFFFGQVRYFHGSIFPVKSDTTHSYNCTNRQHERAQQRFGRGRVTQSTSSQQKKDICIDSASKSNGIKTISLISITSFLSPIRYSQAFDAEKCTLHCYSAALKISNNTRL